MKTWLYRSASCDFPREPSVHQAYTALFQTGSDIPFLTRSAVLDRYEHMARHDDRIDLVNVRNVSENWLYAADRVNCH